jgi:methylglutaconyl-CoA hydratase
MNKIRNIETEISGDTATIWLNRPSKGNAMNMDLIREFTDQLRDWENRKSLRFILIRGRGKHFCAGADLNWMSASAGLTKEENLRESQELAALFESVYHSGKICIAVVEGACYGGGIGLASVCDFVFAGSGAIFSFGEIRLGLVPATIAPFVAGRTGTSRAKRLMLTGRVINAEEAMEAGLVDQLIPDKEAENEIAALLKVLRAGSPKAQEKIKSLLNSLTNEAYSDEIRDRTSQMIAESRISDEGREGIRAFLEKRTPNWNRE